MKLCAASESLGHLSFSEAAKASAGLGLAGLEIGTGNWCAAPHAKLESLLESKVERGKFLEVLEKNGLALVNCNGNHLHPVDGKRQRVSIEHEDIVLSRMEGIRRSIDLLKRTMIEEASDYAMPIA